MSAFNLRVTVPGLGLVPLENAFQASKVFVGGGPFIDLLHCSPRTAKVDERIRTSGRLLAFEFANMRWPLSPTTAFYDWLYLSALREQPSLVEQLSGYQAFTDIAFNPKKSLNCQARSAALFVALTHKGRLTEVLSSQSAYLEALREPGNEVRSGLWD